MNRRAFLRTTTAVPVAAVLTSLPRVAVASAPGQWRVFEVTTKAEVLFPAGVPARDVYGVRVARSQHGYASLGVGTENITRAQHCRAEFYSPAHGWVPVDPADVRKVVLEEPPGKLAMTDEKVVAARKRLFGSWEMNWLAYSYAHDVELPGGKPVKIPYFMYPNGETAQGRLDQLDPDNFKYTITARELKSA